MNQLPQHASWLTTAFQPAVVKRALGYLVVVGTILISINHGDAILRGDINSTRLIKTAPTLMVPYFVSTFSSVGAMRAMNR